ncbi:MAG TPA: hypothetical protein VFB94_15315 [Acidimicrobiales bacterium]|nr:hypothetical protein [Acidimicrobiales bacterium]
MSVRKRATAAGSAVAMMLAFAGQAGADSGDDAATAQLDDWSQRSPEAAERIAIMRDAGLTDRQVVTLIEDPLSVAESSTEYETSDNVTITDEPTDDSVPVGDGLFAAPAAGAEAQAAAGESCGHVITRHDGSAFAQRTARLTLQTDWCWKGGTIQGTPIMSHSSSVTTYGTAGGWRVGGSYDGSHGWLGTGHKRYRTEAKADWTLQACVPFVACQQVGSGTAWARHEVDGSGHVRKSQGGWP